MSAKATNTPNGAEPDYWRSVDEWMNTDSFRTMMKDEFPEDASEWLDPVSRRSFLALSAASVALASGCNPSFKPASQRKVVPYVKQPEHILPGVPLFFSTAMAQHNGVGLGLIVKQTEGRPIKVEGNPNQATSAGACNLQALASPLDLYDPDRSGSSGVMQKGGLSTQKNDSVINKIKTALTALSNPAAPATAGTGVVFLTEPTTSPTLIALMEQFLAANPKSKWLTYEPVSRDNVRKAAKAAFTKNVNQVVNYANAKVVLSLDSDFLTTGAPGAARAFGKARRARHLKVGAEDGVVVSETKNPMNRLYVVEAMTTSTGAVADHRLPLKPSQLESFARALAAKLGITGATDDGKLPDLAKKYLDPLAKDLLANKGSAAVVVGDHATPATHLLAHAINAKIEADKGDAPAISFTKQLEPTATQALAGWPGDDSLAALKTLVEEMNAGKVTLLVMAGVNPVYDAPADLKFAEALDKLRSVKDSIALHAGYYHDETTDKATHHLNLPHYLESWGDVRGHDGAITIQQPLIAPMKGGKTLIEVLATLLNSPFSEGLELVKDYHRKAFEKSATKSGTFDRYWEEGLKYGKLPNSEYAKEAVVFKGLEQVNDKDFTAPVIADLEIQFRPDPVLFDGRQANNGWLHELPKPISNLTWDNAAYMSPRTAEKLKISEGYTFNTYRSGERGCTETDIVKLTVNGRTVEVAAHAMPGLADDVVVFHLGYGRTKAGRVGSPSETGSVAPGFNAYAIRATDAFWSAKVDCTRANRNHFLAIAGAHYAMESRRPVRHATVKEFLNDEDFAQIPSSAPAEAEVFRAHTPGTPENTALLNEMYPGEKRKHPYEHEDPGHVHEHAAHDKRIKPLSLYPGNPIKVAGKDANLSYRRWAMAIDLGSCTGCGACTLACVAENNIPVVGKEQVMRGRAMHWIRIDRYYSIPVAGKLMSDDLGAAGINGPTRKARIQDSEKLKVHVQPVNCQQCEKAPCEVVCPVGATVHSADGLNDMAYNRCVGTRYCSNNCPYKVRRFNFLQYTDYTTDSLKLLNNPEVTVRTRGVMEKCTYCTQRIRNAEMEAEREWKTRPQDGSNRPKILDGEILTACQQACPTGSIMFGDLNDDGRDGTKPAAILRWKAEPHNYGLLADLNTMPRTSYLAAIRNPNPELEKALMGEKGAEAHG
jgi:MoCo/4Fe-4S cofactor protein with predicted Tat translocation signal